MSKGDVPVTEYFASEAGVSDLDDALRAKLHLGRFLDRAVSPEAIQEEVVRLLERAQRRIERMAA